MYMHQVRTNCLNKHRLVGFKGFLIQAHSGLQRVRLFQIFTNAKQYVSVPVGLGSYM